MDFDIEKIKNDAFLEAVTELQAEYATNTEVLEKLKKLAEEKKQKMVIQRDV